MVLCSWGAVLAVLPRCVTPALCGIGACVSEHEAHIVWLLVFQLLSQALRAMDALKTASVRPGVPVVPTRPDRSASMSESIRSPAPPIAHAALLPAPTDAPAGIRKCGLLAAYPHSFPLHRVSTPDCVLQAKRPVRVTASTPEHIHRLSK